MRYHLTKKSTNAKVGKIPVTTSGEHTCPPECPFRGSGCYADAGPLALHWRKVSASERGDDWKAFVADLTGCLALTDARQLWRHNQAGDLPGTGSRINGRMLQDLVRANGSRRGWTYTHKPVLDRQGKHAASNREKIAKANRDGFAVNLSANSPAHADELVELGIGPVATVLPADVVERSTTTPAGRKIVTCPATLPDSTTTCEACGLCAVRDQRRPIIGFPAHGTYAKKASAIASD